MDGIQINVVTENAVTVMKIRGVIDAGTAVELEKSLEHVFQEKKYRLVLDLSEVEYISSAGWGVFTASLKGTRAQGGDIRMAAMASEIGELFDPPGFSGVFESFPTVAEGIKSFGQA